MKILKYLLIIIILVSCHESQISYEEAMHKCMRNINVIEFSLENGTKGISYENYDNKCIIGAQLPSFETETRNGNRLSSDNLRGKINVINFWFNACKPCIAEIPGLNKIAEEYKNKEVNFLSISRDDEATLQKSLSLNQFNFTHILTGKDIIQNKFHHKGGFPTTIITDRHLKIVEIISGGKSGVRASEDIVNKLKPIIEQLLI